MLNIEDTVTTSLLLPVIKEIITNKLKDLTAKKITNNNQNHHAEANLQKYLVQRYEEFLVLDTLAFPNKQTHFDILYEPLSIQTSDLNEDQITIKIDNYSESLFPRYCRVIIEDTAGMGKSTIAKKLFRTIIDEQKGIPVLIELRRLNNTNSILKETLDQLSPLNKEVDLETIFKIIQDGGFHFIFDGFDEISLFDRDFVINDLHKFIQKANQNYFLITSRPEDSLTSFGDFQKFQILPLKKQEAFDLIKRYDKYSYRPIASSLIKALKSNKETSLNEYLENPLLVSLLFKSFEYKKDIPIKKTQFYRQVFDALFESHDLSKDGYLKRDKYSKLHLDDFDRVLRYISYFTAIENKIEYDRNYILNVIDKAKKHLTDLKFQSSDFLKDLLETVPLFKKDGNSVKWAHKSLQDFFAAKFIWIDARERQESILKKIYLDEENSRFYNLLDLFYELDPQAFEKSLLLWLLQDFESFSNSSYRNISTVDKALIQERIENTFNKKCLIQVTKENDFETIRRGSRSREDDKLENYYRRKILDLNYLKAFHSTFNYFKHPKVIVLSNIDFASNRETILKLISKKIPTLATFRIHKIHLDKLDVLQQDSVYEVNDDSNNVLNDPKIFGLVNDLLISDYSIKFRNAIKKLKELRSTTKIKVQDDFVDW